MAYLHSLDHSFHSTTQVGKEKGEFRVRLMREYYELRGYTVHTWKIEENGLDMVCICEKGNEILGIEITNWNEDCYLSMDRFRRMKLNWENLGNQLRDEGDRKTYRKIIVYSFESNIENMLSYLEKLGVELKCIGYQDLPESSKGWND